MLDLWLSPWSRLEMHTSQFVVSCAVPVRNVSWMLFQEGRTSNFRLRRGDGQAAHVRNNPQASVLEFTGNKQWIWLIEVKCIEFNSRDFGSPHYHTHWSSSSIQSCWSPFEIFFTLQMVHKAAIVNVRQPTHCLRDKHLARPLVNKNK
jgi:hypothetical protein